MAELTDPEPMSEEVQRAFEALRSEHELRSLNEEESGAGVDGLPEGVYGFTYSPAQENFPLFKDRDLRSYEGHKLSDGSVVLLGFLTAEEKQAFEGGKAKIHLFPEPKGGADQLVRIPMSRVSSHVEHSQRAGTGLEMEVD